MSFDGTGTYNLVAGLEANLANGQTNDGTEVYAAFADVATALSTCITKNGQSTLSANIPMGTYILTGLGAGSAAGHSLRYEQVFTLGAITLLGPLAWVDGTKTAPGLRTAASSTTGFFSDTGNTIAVSCNDTEIARWTANGMELTAGQIKFPATQNPSADANTLDDYEEGTFSSALALTFETPGDLSVAYTTKLGFYTKIGRVVHATVDIVTSTFTHTTASGNLQITGMPFTSANNNGQTHSGAGSLQGITKAGYTDFDPRMAHNSAVVVIGAVGSGQLVSNVTAADAPTGGTVHVRFSITYMV